MINRARSPATTRIARHGFVWMALGLLALLGALVMGVASAWLMLAATEVTGEPAEMDNAGLFMLGSILMAFIALFGGCLGGLAIDQGLNTRRSRKRGRRY